MKKLQTLMTAAILSWMSVSAGTAQAGNYRPTNPGTTTTQVEAQKFIGPQELKSANGSAAGVKTANYYNSCYTVPACNGSYCMPVTQCNPMYSPYGQRPYFPASNCGYGGYGGYPAYGGVGYPAYGGGYGGYGGYPAPVYGAPMNPGYGVPYGSPVMGGQVGAPMISPVGNPGLGSPYLSPVGGAYPSSFNSGVNGGYNGGFNSGFNGGYGQPVITQPVSNPGYGSPFYP